MKPGQFCWNDLATPSLEEAKEFYSQAFGWTFTDHKMEHGVYSMISNGDQEFGGMWEISADQKNQIPPHWMSYIWVENLDDSLEKVKKLGGTIKVEKTKVKNMGQFAIIVDPVGAHVAMWETFEKK